MKAQELRARAESSALLTRSDARAMSGADVERLVYELQVHQVELEMQNETLRHTQAELEQAQEEYRALFDHAPAGYLLLDADGVIVRANVAATRLLAPSRGRVAGQRLAEFLAADSLAAVDAHLNGAESERGVTCEVRLRAPHGSTTHVRLDTQLAPIGEGRRLSMLTEVVDGVRSIERSERREEGEPQPVSSSPGPERDIERLKSEIVARARSQAKERDLEAKLRDTDRMASLGMLAAGIAHDFNNLLVSVLGSTELLLQTTELPEAWRDQLGLIKRAGQNASDLTRQLLVFAGMGRVALAPVHLPDVLVDSLRLLRSGLSPRIQLQYRVGLTLSNIQADRGQVHQLVMNLVTNAIEALDGSGTIVVEAQEMLLDSTLLAAFQYRAGAVPGRFAVLRVQDSGPGIAPETLTRIFDPFFTTKFTGRGLGLATALGIVQSHRGALRVHSAPGQGATFEVAFPLAEVRPESALAPETLESEWTGSGSVLVVDDDAAVRSVVCQMLELLGLDVTGADGGAQGLELFTDEKHRFDLVVLDWVMPTVSGEQVLKVVRERAPHMPVILVSGFCTQDLATHDERLVRVQKPMTLSELRDAVRSVLETGREAQLPRVASLTG